MACEATIERMDGLQLEDDRVTALQRAISTDLFASVGHILRAAEKGIRLGEIELPGALQLLHDEVLLIDLSHLLTKIVECALGAIESNGFAPEEFRTILIDEHGSRVCTGVASVFRETAQALYEESARNPNPLRVLGSEAAAS